MPHLFKKRDEVDPCDKDDSCLVAIGSFNVQEKKIQISKYAYSWQICFLNKNKTQKSCLLMLKHKLETVVCGTWGSVPGNMC